MRLIRSLISLGVLAAFILIAATVPIGNRTLFGHVKQIWASDEAQELVDGVKEESGPLYDRVKRGVKAGVKEAADPAVSDPNADPNAETDPNTAAGEDGKVDSSKEDAAEGGATAKKTD